MHTPLPPTSGRSRVSPFWFAVATILGLIWLAIILIGFALVWSA